MSINPMSSKLKMVLVITAAGFILSGFSFSKAIEENGRSYIVDLHGELWDVTSAEKRNPVLLAGTLSFPHKKGSSFHNDVPIDSMV